MPQEKEKKGESLGESMARAGRFVGSQREAQKKKKSPVEAIQEFARQEAERKKKEEERKKKQPVDTGPTKGFLRRMYERYMGTSEEK